MTNIVPRKLDEIEVEEQYLPEVLKCLLNTIVFQRALLGTSHVDYSSETLNTTYACASENLKKDIDTEVSNIIKHIKPPSSHEVILKFYEEQRSYFVFSGNVEWEWWTIPIKVVVSSQPKTEQTAPTIAQKSKAMAPKALIEEVEKRLKQIIKLALEKTDHIDIKKEKFTKDKCSYPFKIEIPTVSKGWFQ